MNLTFDLESYRLTFWKNIYEAVNSKTFQSFDEEFNTIFNEVFEINHYWAYPGYETLLKLKQYQRENNRESFHLLCRNLYETLVHKTYQAQEFVPFYTNLNNLDKPQSNLLASHYSAFEKSKNIKPYFEVLIIHPNPEEYESLYRHSLANQKTINDDFLYDIIFVDNYYDAIIAILSNTDIQACLYLDNITIHKSQQFPFESLFSSFFNGVSAEQKNQSITLKKHISHLRPELDHFYMCEDISTEQHKKHFNRIIYAQSPSLFADIHSLVLSGIEKRYSTPFFDALRSYAKRPKSSFHALPISQGESVDSSHWIKDVADFYGDGLFSAETSSTLGGMDSIMDPRGSISQAQKKAAELFQSKNTYFITNGTTTANKIVMQANLHPDDIVLVSSDCHKSIPYSILLSGATPIFLETYPLQQYDLYGCVTLKRIKQVLLDLKNQNQLHRVKQITLTNSTFDGILYDVKRYMFDILAIKPDIIFHWDEAWFSFAYFNPLYQSKTAMSAANALTLIQNDDEYKHIYKQWKDNNTIDDDFILNNDLYPDPKVFKVRVYATQSVHKTLTAFRQASMLHVHDVDFIEDNFYEAYRTHTSTSPNYQIIASLDFARRQMSLEGYHLVKNSIKLAWQLRRDINASAHLNKFFKVLDDRHLVPEDCCRNVESDNQFEIFYPKIYQCYKEKLFVIDPTRITVDISTTGIDGPNFRQMLMTQYDIQVNKTSHNTILFIINIGVDENNIRYLLESLHHIANKLNHSPDIYQRETYNASLPLTRSYHKKFVAIQSETKNNFQAVDIRRAYYAGLIPSNTIHIQLTTELLKDVVLGAKLISAGFITPYPPGFPIVVPGQLITYDILLYLQNIQIKEIHGYNPEQGMKIFTAALLSREEK